jgi:uncharacterized SAM-binding protein YcdF (DUF218 family)
MFFYLSKLFWIFAEPSNFVGFVMIICIFGLATRYRRAAHALLAVTAIGYAFCGFGPGAAWLMRPLEDRFPRPGPDLAAPDGIIVLGGAMDELVSAARGASVLNDSGSRMTEAVALAFRFPKAKLIFTGGSGELLPHDVTEADIARQLFISLGVAPERLTMEDRSRNTYENAIFTRELIHPKPTERFLLVTSGFHTPRSMGIFRRAGFNVTPWPADYTTSGKSGDFRRINLHSGTAMVNTDRAVREWIGLVAYRISGMTDALFPAP